MTDSTEEFLAHFGVKGMKWGQRKATPTGASRRTDREAHRDANEFAKAKLFYGQGAGTRRKLIKATVESKSTKDPEYKKAFDHHLSTQDLGKRAEQARGERKRKDTSAAVGKTARGVHRKLTGGFGNVSLAATVIAGGAIAAHQSGTDKLLLEHGKKTLRDVQSSAAYKAAKDYISKKL